MASEPLPCKVAAPKVPGDVIEADGPGPEPVDGLRLALPRGATGLGADTPAISEPKPSFWRLSASSLPLASRPFEDWNFCMAATVLESHLPFGSPSRYPPR